MNPDSITQILVDGGHVFARIQQVLWVMLRIGALLMVMPLLSTHAVPMRIRALLALTLSVAVAPLLPLTPALTHWQATTVLAVVRELAVGATLGFLLRLMFEAASLAGEWVAQGTGLAFAQMNDPLRGGNSGVLGQWFYLLFGLLFFTSNGHLAFIALVLDSYHALPIGNAWPDLHNVVTWVPTLAGQVFRSALTLALPLIVAMLAVNLAFGVLARAAPTLNPMQLGLPVTVLLGLFFLTLLAGDMAVPVQHFLDNALIAMRQVTAP